MAPTDVSYVPGALTAVAGDHCWALVETSPNSPAVTSVWRQLGQGAAPGALLAALIAGGIEGTPGFALLVQGAGGQYRLFCRDGVGATVVRVAGHVGGAPGAGQAAIERIEGTGLITWREQVVDGADRILLGSPPADTALRLPATSGVLLADCVIIDLTNAASRNTVSQEQDEPSPQPPDEYQGPPQPWRPLPDAAWSDSAYPGGAHPGAVQPGGPMTGPAHPPTPMPPPVTARGQNPPGGMPPNVTPSNPPSNGAPGGLIDAPPWLSSANRPGGAGQPASQAPSTGMPTGQVPLGQPPAGPVPGNSAPTGPSPSMGGPAEPRYTLPRPEPGRGESDSTVKRGELPEIITVTTPPDRIGPVVPALLCPGGHVNPPSGATCRRCGAPLPHDPVPVPRPVLGVLRLSFGDVITLDRGVLMGRNPRPDFAGSDGFGGAGGEERPHVVRLPSADGDISRTHLRVTLDGWHVLVTDLNSTNGTLITLPGRDPQRLRPGEPVPIQPGTVVALADGIDFRYEVTE